MVNEAYLNRLNAGLLQGFSREGGPSAYGEVGQVDYLDPIRLRVDQQRADRQRDAVGNSGLPGMQPHQPGLPGERVGQRPLPELEQQQRQGSAEQGGIDQIAQQMVKAEP